MNHGPGKYSHRLSYAIAATMVLFVALSFAEETRFIGILNTPTMDDRNSVAAMGTEVYWDFEDRLLAACTERGIAALEKAGFPFFTISKDLHAGGYFLVLFDPGEKIARETNVLWHDGTMRLVHLSQTGAARARDAGVRLVKLPSRPHALSIETPAPPLAPIERDSLVGQCIGQVRSDSILNYIRTMQNFQTRYSFAANCRKAEEYLHAFFSSLQLDSVAYDEWSDNGKKARNVIATQVGAVKPDSIMVICAHLDSYSDKFTTNAPGADDDASGVAGVMEAARVLSTMKLRWTIKYIAFTGEEQWMKGSGHWVEKVAVPGKLAIFGVYNIDMIGYPPYDDKNTMYVFPNTGSTILGDMAAQINTTYQLGLSEKHPVDNSAAGDHTPFWQNRYKAVFVIEAKESDIWNGISPHYHTTADTLGNLSPALLHKTIKMTTGCIAQWAGPLGSTAIRYASGPARGGKRIMLTKGTNRFGWRVSLSDPSSRAVLKVCTAQGRIVYASPVFSSSLAWNGTDEMNVPVPNGMYVMQVVSRNGEAAFRVMVAR